MAKSEKPIPAGMIRCPDCENGWREVDEPGYDTIRDACYHCGNTGFITDEQARKDRIRNVAEMLGHRAMDAERQARNNNPDGEDFAFCAAENQCSEYEYSLGVASGYAMRFDRLFEEMDKRDRCLLDVLIDAVDPPKPVENPSPEPVPARRGPSYPPPDDFDYEGDTDIDEREHPAPVPPQTNRNDNDDIPF